MRAHGAHLVGSVPLADAEAVFRAVAGEIGDRVRRIPDGETGERSGWTTWQWPAFANNPLLQPLSEPSDGKYETSQFRLREGASPVELTFGELGYAAVALASYEAFARLKQQGVIPASTRFQMSIPTPIALVQRFVTAADRAAVEPAYERAVINEVQTLAKAVPQRELAVQWDIAHEIAMWEWENGRREFRYLAPQAWFPNVKDGIVARLARLGDAVPAGVELGIHLCYGNRNGEHFVEPADTGTAVEIANAVFARIGRDVTWLHLPVPRDRADAAYFAPLRDLQLPGGTEFYLGLVHEGDGVAGTTRRIDEAAAVVAEFGASTECGFGRRSPDAVATLLELHRDVTRPV